MTNTRLQTMQAQHSTADSSPAAQTFNKLIEASLSLPPEYDRLLTSHLPMALHGLYRLGAPAQRMQDFFDDYSRRFVGVPSLPKAKAVTDWRTLKGAQGAYPALCTTFRQLIEREGLPEVLRAALPDLLPGVAAAAFHGVIRTAHAIECGHLGETAAALAYWAWRWQPLAEPSKFAPHLAFEAWSDQLDSHAQVLRMQGDLISIRMEQATHSDAYRDLAMGPVLPKELPLALERLAAQAVKLYAASPNFTVLHMVTGLRALRLLMPWMDRCQNVLPILVRAYTAAILAADLSSPVHRSNSTLATWTQIIESALESNDDHVIKLVHACVDEAGHYGNGLYQQAASLVVAQNQSRNT